jgi:hypothetical protein
MALALPAGLALLSELSVAAETLEAVRGRGCYTYGDEDTPAKAKKAAMALARQQAVEGYRVYVQSVAVVKNFQLEDDLVQTASVGMLQDVQVEKQEKKDQEICITITAKISPVKMEELIQQKTKAKDIAQAAQAPVLSGGSGFGLKVRANKAAGESYLEGEPLIISVESEKDAYLKLDYYQADGTVVHLVPNVYSGEAFIRAGKTYTFGDPGGPAPFRITGPFGAETIKAIASTKPFDQELMASRNTEESQGYLRGLQSGLRGVRIETSAAWAEAAVGLITVSKAVAEDNEPLAGMRGAKRTPPEPNKPPTITGVPGGKPHDQSQQP